MTKSRKKTEKIIQEKTIKDIKRDSICSAISQRCTIKLDCGFSVNRYVAYRYEKRGLVDALESSPKIIHVQVKKI